MSTCFIDERACDPPMDDSPLQFLRTRPLRLFVLIEFSRMESTLGQCSKQRREREARFSKQPGFIDLSSLPQAPIESRWSEGGKTISLDTPNGSNQ